MKFREALFILLILCVIFSSINSISAEDYDNASSIVSLTNQCVDADLLENSNDGVKYENSNDNEIINEETLSENGVYEIYVGQNTTDKGVGTFENPFANLTLACDDANVNHHNTVNVKIKEGIYYLGGQLDFNTDNLIIQGEGEVIIKNLYDYDLNKWDMSGDALYGEAFGLTSSSSNITFYNIIFDTTGRSTEALVMDLAEYGMQGVFKSYFVPFYGQTNLAIFNNCSFIGYHGKNYLTGSEYNSHFINCLWCCPLFNFTPILGLIFL